MKVHLRPAQPGEPPTVEKTEGVLLVRYAVGSTPVDISNLINQYPQFGVKATMVARNRAERRRARR